MSQTKKRNLQINKGSLKINRISLLNQSDFQLSLQKMYIPQRNLDIFKELILNNKGTEKPFDIYFTPIQNINSNIRFRGNIYKINPLTEKNKIIKKHNILKKIDFNINPLKNNVNKKNKLELYLYNNNDNIYNTRQKLSINKFKDNKESINLPLLTNTSRKQKKNNIIDLINNINKSSSDNEFSPINNSSSSIKLFNNNKEYYNIFSNEKLKNTCVDKKQKLKPNISDKEIQTNISIIKNEIHEKKIKYNNNELNLNESNDESSNNDNIQEIENIISKSNFQNNNNYHNINNYKNNSDFHNYQNKENKSNYILLKRLYREKNYDNNDYNIFSEKSKTERNIFLKGDNNKRKLNGIKNRSIYYLNKDIILINRNHQKENKEKKNFNEKYISIPYNYKKTIIQKNIISTFLNSNNNFIKNNSICRDSY